MSDCITPEERAAIDEWLAGNDPTVCRPGAVTESPQVGFHKWLTRSRGEITSIRAQNRQYFVTRAAHGGATPGKGRRSRYAAPVDVAIATGAAAEWWRE